jgi:hypothetical protein
MMSATALNAHDWINTFRDSLLPQLDGIHPSAQRHCHDYLNELHDAVNAGDMTEFARLLHLLQDKISDELIWEEDKLRSANDRNYVPRCMRHD